ncbi:hypothetical protein FGO68_gene14470 [Halteria grandinella]|uniref:Uncharacterized protein n=1 Tax=Halteria grandinella TaxID=5974 RepID=A0A8J8T2L7_HALGN|nr:hypothetical protein FGO68_gene14470 [Halteria grandinella]
MKLKDLSDGQLFRKLIFPIASYEANEEEISRHECDSQVQLGIMVEDEFRPLYTTKIYPTMSDESFTFCVFTPPTPQHFSTTLHKGYEDQLLLQNDLYGTFFAFNYRFLNASDKEIWFQTDLASVAEQSGIHYYRHFIPILYKQNQEAMVSFRGVIYGDTDDIYGKFDGFFDYVMTEVGLKDHYVTRFLFQNENLELSQYPIPELEDNKDIYIFLNQEVLTMKRQPSSLVDAISRLGGILAIVNIGFFISMVNKHFFKKAFMNQFFPSNKPLINQTQTETTLVTDLQNTTISKLSMQTTRDLSNCISLKAKKCQITETPQGNTPETLFSMETFLEMKQHQQRTLRLARRNSEPELKVVDINGEEEVGQARDANVNSDKLERLKRKIESLQRVIEKQSLLIDKLMVQQK